MKKLLLLVMISLALPGFSQDIPKCFKTPQDKNAYCIKKISQFKSDDIVEYPTLLGKKTATIVMVIKKRGRALLYAVINGKDTYFSYYLYELNLKKS